MTTAGRIRVLAHQDHVELIVFDHAAESAVTTRLWPAEAEGLAERLAATAAAVPNRPEAGGDPQRAGAARPRS